MGVPPPQDSSSLWDYLLSNQVLSNLLYENYFLLFKWVKCALSFPSKLSFLCLSVCWLCFRPCVWVFHPHERNQPLQASSLCTDVPHSLRKKSGEKISSPDFFLRKRGTSHRLQASCWGTLQKRETKQGKWKGPALSTTFLPLSCSLPSPCDFYPPYPRREHVHRFLYFKTRVWWPPLFSWLVPPFNENQIGKSYVQVFFYHFTSILQS